MEDNHIGCIVGGGLVSEKTPADVVQLQTFVPVKAVGAAEWPVPQKDADVSLRNIWMVFLQIELLVEEDVIAKKRGEGNEEKQKEAPLGWGCDHHCRVYSQPKEA